MNAWAPSAAAPDIPAARDRAATAAAQACYHCAESLPSSPTLAIVAGAQRAFCCAGCAAATQWIGEANLLDYYRLRDVPAARVQADPAELALWDRPEVLAEHAHRIQGGLELTLITDGMRCAACAWLIDRALCREPGVLEVSANAVTGRIRIAWDPQRTMLSAPLARLQSLGYRAWLAAGQAQEASRRRERNRWLLRLGLAGLGAMQAMMFAEALYLDTSASMPLPTRDFLRWATWLISTPVVFYAGWPFLAGAWRELRERRLGMDTLVASSTLLAYFASVIETLRGGPHVWYDAAVMFVFLLLTARMLEQRVRSRATAQLDALARARPAFATRECADGGRQTIPTSALRVGDIARVAAGEAVPADGQLVGEASSFEESLLTGEPHPVHKTDGAPVFAGTVCRERPARVRVLVTGAGTRLSQLAALVERAQAHRPPMALAADRIAAWFVTAMLVLAAAVYLAWRLHEPARAFEVTLALLVISCPCALSLAVPAALAAANASLARMGVLPMRADALERLARTTDVVFDKTGTLGTGRPALLQYEGLAGFDREEALTIAAGLERDSGHPLAGAFLEAAAGLPAVEASGVELVPGQGVQGRVAGRTWRLGRAGFAGAGEDDAAIWLGDGTRAVARFVVQEPTRADAHATLHALHDQGLELHLSSGDGSDSVERFARAFPLVDVRARQTPEDKLSRVRELQKSGRVVAMVGDGLNDAPVLAGADVSIAIGEGAALAQRSADLVLATPALDRIPAAFALAVRTRTVIRQNLAWAIGYNVLALPLAAAGLVTPWLAALGMALSSLTVTLNALRLSRGRRA